MHIVEARPGVRVGINILTVPNRFFANFKFGMGHGYTIQALALKYSAWSIVN
jgi:hypothetical protein